MFKLTTDYHRHIAGRLKASGLSPEQLKIHERILELARTASGVDDLEAKKSAENLTFALGRALSVDAWAVKARAAEESEDTLGAQVFTDTAQAARQATDNVSLASAIDGSSTQGMERLREQEEAKTAFVQAVYAVFDYRSVHPANTDKIKKVIANLRLHLQTLSRRGMQFADLAANPFFRHALPLTDPQWQQVLTTFKEIDSPPSDSDARSKLDREITEGKATLRDKSGPLKEITRHIEENGTRLAYLAVALDDEPGPYTFEKIWEGPRDG